MASTSSKGAKVAAAGAKLVAQIEVNNSAAISAVNEANKAFDQFDKMLDACDADLRKMEKSMGLSVGSIQKQAKAVQESETSWVKMAATMYTVRNAAHMVAGGFEALFEAANQGAKNMAAAEFFKNAGHDIESYRKATNGMISDAELMKKANLADSMGISEQVFKKLALVAEASALKTGQSFDYMFNSIIVGTARSSRLLLDNLGIIVNVRQANERYAEAIGKTVDELSAQEKQIAFSNEVARKSTGTLDEYAATTDRTAESFAKFEAAISNMADAIREKLAKAFSKTVPWLTDIITELEKVIDGLDRVSGHKVVAMGLLGGLAGGLAAGPAGILIGGLAGAASTGIGDAYAGGNASQNEARKTKDALEDTLLSLLREARGHFGGLGIAPDRDAKLQFLSNFSKIQIEQLKEVDPAWADLIDRIRQTASALGVLPKAIVADDFGGGKDKKGKERQYNTAGVMGMYAEEDAMMKEYWKSRKKSDLDKQKAAQFVEEENRKLNQKLLKGQLEALEKWREAQEDLAEAARKLKEDADKQFLSDVSGLTTSALSGQGGSALGGMLGGAASGAIGGPIGAVIGALVAVLGDLLDSLQPLMTLVNQIVGGLGLFLSNALTPLLSALLPLGPALVALLGSLGMMFRAMLEPLVFIIKLIVVPLSMFISLLAAGGAILTTVIQLLSSVLGALFFINSGTGVGDAFERFSEWLDNGVTAVADFTNGILSAVASINNGIVNFIRRIPGMGDFGSLMTAAQFTLPGDTADQDTVDNTDAVKENTTALRDLQREFRNMPANYKGNGAIFGATDPERTGTGFRPDMRRSAAINQRWRT